MSIEPIDVVEAMIADMNNEDIYQPLIVVRAASYSTFQLLGMTVADVLALGNSDVTEWAVRSLLDPQAPHLEHQSFSLASRDS